MKKMTLKEGWVVQLSPTDCKNPMFGGCFMTITEPKEFGAQGYVQALGEKGEVGKVAYYRASWNEMELIGVAEWFRGGN